MLRILIGPSCSGKSTLLECLNRHYANLGLPEFIPLESVTTRPPRKGGERADNYRFVSNAVFDHMEKTGQFAWRKYPHGLPHRYGTRISTLCEALRSPKQYVGIFTLDVLPIICKLAVNMPEQSVKSLYLHIEDEEEIRRRLTEDGRSDIEARLDFRAWNEEAVRVKDSLYWIDARKPPHDVLAQALYHLEHAQNPPPNQ